MKMSFGERLKEARNRKKLKQSELAKQLGVKNTTISNWENNISKPDLDMLSYICGALGVNVSYFLDAKIPDDDVTIQEFELIKKYRDLDDFGRENVHYVLDRENERLKQIEELKKISTSETSTRFIQYYQRLASAGTGQVIFEDMPIDRIEIPDIPEYKRVSYAIGVNGNSMEPLYYNGDMLLIEPTCDVNVGEIGIFIVGSEAYVKKLGKNELISLNTGYENIPLTEDSKCMGRVVGKLMI